RPPELVLVQVIGDAQVDHVPELVADAQVIDHQDVVDAARVEAAHEIAADEAGAAGHDDHDESSCAVTMNVPSLPTTMPPARFAQAIDSFQSSSAARAT